MIAAVIRWSLRNRLLVLLATLIMAAWGVWSVQQAPLDALPDLSDTQVIIRVSYPGKAPQIVEDQVTYPLTTTMLSVPGAKTVRGFSMFGDAYVYVLFDDGTDPYWARSRVLEYLSQVQSSLPPEAKASLGPDATGVGWVFEYVLTDKSGQHSLGDLRAIQDWILKYELKTVPDVSEVASVGGMVKEYQVILNPDRLRALNVTHEQVISAIQSANQEGGGSVLELGEAEYMVRTTGYLKSIDDFNQVVIAARSGVPVLLSDVASVRRGPAIRRGVAELNGQGEVAGGIIIMRSGKNALSTINAVKAKLAEVQKSLPAGVEIVPVYDRSQLIKNSVETLTHKLIEEFIVVAVVCSLFLFHFRSALVAMITLPLGILGAFIVMHYQGVSANMMSLGGIAIAIGAMVDAAIVMIENMHKVLEQWRHEHPERQPSSADYWQIAQHAASEVGPALFCSLLIITLSFIPVFTLEAQEGKMFSPLAFTKTYSMAVAAGLGITLVPVLMGYFIRGKIPDETANPLNRWLIRAYEPLLDKVLQWPKATLAAAGLLLVATLWPLAQLGSEFLPQIDEGDLLYMPSTLPGISSREAGRLLQQTDRLIKTIPEVQSVFGKAGRADSATDPAPLTMLETTIQFKPKSEWRPGMTMDKLIEELDNTVKVPGIANVWVPPIRNRLDMLATGIKSPVGIKVNGNNLAEIEKTAEEIERIVRSVPGVTSALAERLDGGRYIDIAIDRVKAARYGVSVKELQSIVASVVGGDNIGETIEGRERYPIGVRYPREMRDSLQKLRDLPVVTSGGAQVALSELADITITDGPPMLKSENARLSDWIYVDIRGRDLKSAVDEMQSEVGKRVRLPEGISLTWSGQYEYLERATAKLKIVLPFTLMIIFILLYVTFSRVKDALLIMGTLPFSLIGGVWLLWLLGYNLSVAAAVGFIALAGVAAEFGVIMVLYLNQAIAKRRSELNDRALNEAIHEGAVLRVRPKVMTVATIMAGLLPIMWGGGTGSEVMQRIAAPMIGGMITAPLLSMLVIPAVYLLTHRNKR
ncbi:TPA: efflux RND transporter permease subunit [Klebsiella michiganensis]|uniref:Putative cation efflux system protein n=1 Tax=Klebsiella michiganensis (strain ATCC 8724 / DSM 4798 / JCM 20051 / NBRC 3318 / NRRL B-199 / KCTC 1686 / BUCSAV 143 / CCM 1901) TaxID=1006551 RepID=A0A0H3H9N9_KLEM8|nr:MULTISPECIES: efflux RND transporter permease subunit [Klebsiella]AID90378.1 cation transporter [Klebsiella oxytoca KONIH1]AUV92198.1 CusA/CzcA family heavy metal efflux RND transporter [Klebsiella oxytoca]OFU85443.1 cation transporter [Proteus sp. HMSC10D02]AEX05957.1 putative cation efflux system protein [Klebsiella michiganensis KCTC 1686]AFN32570.1 Cobalt-zinc-cadmium resistance protein CzcA, Cation efflux system protein CusA [Klebsiella michiganensis E718]